MRLNIPRFDSNESAFLSRQLDFIKEKTYDIKYAELKCRKLIPINTSVDPGAERIFYRTYNQSGMAKIISNYADDLPRSQVTGQEFFINVHNIGESYGYNFQELRAAVYAQMPLEQREAAAARRAIAQRENLIAFFGDPNYNMLGFLNNPNCTTLTLPADGMGPLGTGVPNGSGLGSKAWANKTPDQILRDMNLIANTPVTTSFGVEIADTLLLPMVNYNYAANTARSINSDTTILNFFLNNNPYIKMVEWVNELATAGVGNTTRAVAYRRDPDALTLEIPSDFEQLELEKRGLEYVVDCIERIGGVIIYYPLSVCYSDGM